MRVCLSMCTLANYGFSILNQIKLLMKTTIFCHYNKRVFSLSHSLPLLNLCIISRLNFSFDLRALQQPFILFILQSKVCKCVGGSKSNQSSNIFEYPNGSRLMKNIQCRLIFFSSSSASFSRWFSIWNQVDELSQIYEHFSIGFSWRFLFFTNSI